MDRDEHPEKHTRPDDDDDSALLSAYPHDLEKVSENLNDDSGVFIGTGMPDMLEEAWLAIITKTQSSERKVDAHSLEPSQKYVSSLLVTVSLLWMKKPYNTYAAIPVTRQLLT